MKWIESYNLIETFKGDYGTSITYDTIDFEINDLIIVVFENNIIDPKIYIVDKENYIFELFLSKEETQNLEIGDYKFSIKQYRDNKFLETINNGILRIKETIQWEN